MVLCVVAQEQKIFPKEIINLEWKERDSIMFQIAPLPLWGEAFYPSLTAKSGYHRDARKYEL